MGQQIEAWRVKLLPIGDQPAQYNESARLHSMPICDTGMLQSPASLGGEAKR